MLRFVAGFVPGCLIVQFLADLPPFALLALALLVGVSLGVVVTCSWCRALAGLLVGFTWAGGHAWLAQPAQIASLDPQQVYQVQGAVVDMPEIRGERSSFVFRVKRLDLGSGSLDGDWLLRVSWYRAPAVAVGERWTLPLRIKPARGLRNPGGWDYAAWLHRQGITYTGYVARGTTQRLEIASCCRLERLREALRQRVQRLPAGEARGILLGLVLGDRSELSTSLRASLAATGTAHLLAISGLHIGLSAGLFGWLGAQVWRRLPGACARVPARIAGVVLGMSAALVYAAISGMGLPAQRALVMLAVGGLLLLGRYRSSPSKALAAAALAVLLVSPTAVLAAGFWLSFTAVAAILVSLPVLQGRHSVLQAIVIQLAISLALYPVLVAFDMQPSLLGPLINLVLVPLFGALLVPLSLLGVALLAMFDAAVTWVQPLLFVLSSVATGLSHAAEWQPTMPAPAWSTPRWLLLACGVAMVMPGMPLRPLGLVLLLGAHLPSAPPLPWGAFRITMLDVGQGLSLVIETRHRVLVYDTGAAYRSGFNLADTAVLPFLRQRGHSRLDTLLLSHGDNDHAGAAVPLLRGIEVGAVVAGEPVPGIDAQPCVAGRKWRWDGVIFETLWPPAGGGHGGNNASCILLVRNRAGSFLVSGDAESEVEQALAGQLEARAPVDVVVAGHHGSATSSTATWVDAVNARWVLYSAGFLNRYGFPRPQVRARWQAAGAHAVDTRRQGAASFEFAADGDIRGPEAFQAEAQRYWHLPWQGMLDP